MLRIKFYVYWEEEHYPMPYAQLREFDSREELNEFLKEIRGATYIKVISGYTLAERDKNAVDP